MKLKLLTLATLLSLPLLAQITVGPVTGVGKAKDPINLSTLTAAGPNATLFKQTLQRDLELSGWFRVDPAAMTAVAGQITDTADGINAATQVRWAGQSFTWNSASSSTADTRRRAHELADKIVQQIKRKPGLASSRILFIKRNGPDNSDLFVCDADGGNIQQLTFDNRAIITPKWDTNLKDLFLTSYVSGHPVVYRMPVEPRAPKTVIARYNGLNTSAEPSPDGKSIAIILSIFGTPDLFVLDRVTGSYSQLTKTPNASEASPTWSPDSKSICYVSDASGSPQLYVVDVATKQSRRLTTRGSENVNPDWGLDGRICYATRRGGSYQIAVLKSANDREPDVTLSSGSDHEDPSWAPDGRHIICSRGDALWILDTEGDLPVRLFTQPGKWAAPEWSYR